MAISVERDERQALIHVFDALTGAEPAGAFHPPVKLRRSDPFQAPFQARISYLGYTPDDRYSISRTLRYKNLGDQPDRVDVLHSEN